jgi:hypothetical protein
VTESCTLKNRNFLPSSFQSHQTPQGEISLYEFSGDESRRKNLLPELSEPSGQINPQSSKPPFARKFTASFHCSVPHTGFRFCLFVCFCFNRRKGIGREEGKEGEREVTHCHLLCSVSVFA